MYSSLCKAAGIKIALHTLSSYKTHWVPYDRKQLTIYFTDNVFFNSKIRNFNLSRKIFTFENIKRERRRIPLH